ncbi:TIGR03905 family TSCPD domain-containing protein [Sporohalobacter salinus]|uniref:TIGR03905 family TSCPD domain-containing protein n=1 Tax=Sporohalobacter salinus TaxID=1494606 RepID=UPI001960B7DE|nr:TIGR03905 family TSCPD domain-containing protein [Sporohalobacter salinus]MBM7624871.1 uncharacterized protein (TIGR03905 family) [Sporohalobacter salinus]
MKSFKPKGVCAEKIKFKVDDQNQIKKVEFIGGCTGNLAGISNLVKGQKINDVVDRLAGIKCRNKTSCPDQLSKALKKYI